MDSYSGFLIAPDEETSGETPETPARDSDNGETVTTDDKDEISNEDLQLSDEGGVLVEGRIMEVYSSDGNVCIRQDLETFKSVIIDGNEEIPVDIACGRYGPIIEKFDADGDGEEEYLIAECEGTGTEYCVYGLVIVKKNAGRYEAVLYDGHYFCDYIEEHVGFSYDEKKREVTIFEILPEFYDRYEGVTIKLEREAGLEDIVWSNIIRIGFEEGRVIVSVPSGYIFDDRPWVPDYQQAALVRLGLIFHEDGTFGIYVNDISDNFI